MKTIKLFGWILALGCIFSLHCQAQQLPFIGTIQYRIAYASEMIPQEQLAQSPQIATLRMSATKALFTMSEEKTLADAENKMVYTLINLSQLGLGKYRIETPEAELTEEDEDIKWETTGNTKEIFGYTAKELYCKAQLQGSSIEMNIWCVADFCDPFLSHVAKAPVPDSEAGFPLEYTITTPEVSMTFNVHKLTVEDANPKYFNIPSSYKLSTKEKMAADIQEVMQAMQGMGM